MYCFSFFMTFLSAPLGFCSFLPNRNLFLFNYFQSILSHLCLINQKEEKCSSNSFTFYYKEKMSMHQLQGCDKHSREKNVPFISLGIPISSGSKSNESQSWVPMKTFLVNCFRKCQVLCLLVVYLGKVLLKLLSPEMAKLLNYPHQSLVIQSISLPPRQGGIFLLYKDFQKKKFYYIFHSKSHALKVYTFFFGNNPNTFPWSLRPFLSFLTPDGYDTRKKKQKTKLYLTDIICSQPPAQSSSGPPIVFNILPSI